jgi:hypothetical protein
LEANLEEIEFEAEQEDIPKEQAAVKPVGGLRKWHRGRNLGAERRQKTKDRIRVNCGSRRKLAAEGMKTTRRAKVVPRKVNVVRRNRTRVW